MNKVQKIYRVIRPHTTREDARYAAPRLAQLGREWVEENRQSGRA